MKLHPRCCSYVFPDGNREGHDLIILASYLRHGTESLWSRGFGAEGTRNAVILSGRRIASSGRKWIYFSARLGNLYWTQALIDDLLIEPGLFNSGQIQGDKGTTERTAGKLLRAVSLWASHLSPAYSASATGQKWVNPAKKQTLKWDDTWLEIGKVVIGFDSKWILWKGWLGVHQRVEHLKWRSCTCKPQSKPRSKGKNHFDHPYHITSGEKGSWIYCPVQRVSGSDL